MRCSSSGFRLEDLLCETLAFGSSPALAIVVRLTLSLSRIVDEQLEFAKQIASRLTSAGIPYMMTGSMAMAVYAPPRMTRDVRC